MHVYAAIQYLGAPVRLVPARAEFWHATALAAERALMRLARRHHGARGYIWPREAGIPAMRELTDGELPAYVRVVELTADAAVSD